MRKIVITPIAVLLIVAIIISGLTAINGLFINNGGGNSLGGGIALFAALFVLGILVAEQAIVRNLKKRIKAVWIAELFIILVFVIILIAGNFDLSIG